nr:MAG TPA: hypothetical protein [Caudoviricetes sp.]
MSKSVYIESVNPHKINIFQYLCVFAKIVKIFTLEKAK